VGTNYDIPLKKLQDYIASEHFAGYDPYDILTSPIPFRFFGTYAAAVATQLHKRNPINLRPLLGIHKAMNPKGAGLLLYAYATLQAQHPREDYSGAMEYLFGFLRDHVSKGFNGACWGYNFAWASPGKYLPPYAPSGVVTAFVVKGIYAYYRLTNDPAALNLVLSSKDFILKDLPDTVDQTGVCISYTPFKKDCCYNASLLAAETLARCYSITGDESLKSKALDAARFVIARQHDDGRWNYSLDDKTGKERAQVDFHQGYVIDSLTYIQQLTGTELQGGEEAIRNGLEFYRTCQFLESGQSLFRFPQQYPVDIHNQAQGILTYCRQSLAAERSSKSGGRLLASSHASFAETIARWTLHHLYNSKRGYFYYRKYPAFTHRIPYMRWSNAWMLVALTELQELMEMKSNEC
jgi:hypothetical protein